MKFPIWRWQLRQFGMKPNPRMDADESLNFNVYDIDEREGFADVLGDPTIPGVQGNAREERQLVDRDFFNDFAQDTEDESDMKLG